MSYFDLRFVFLLVINIVKSQTAMPWEWDPFNVVRDLTWTKFWLLTILFLIFSFVSILIPLASPNTTMGTFIFWIQGILSVVPDLDIFMTTTNIVEDNRDRLHEGEELEGTNLEDGGEQV
ncbi:hypothetical protein BUALT_Bualt10G0084200 [Buddleja alternifolia]|uniref:Uncharacterized protein n=1 Tax=Buddleja alternifolia TaxID=168488 RepID=A0AAV6X3N4_9LAMI|nr:hypothetical protein BUALT_Bualt10G0084200 [Buddleja alternifolia]